LNELEEELNELELDDNSPTGGKYKPGKYLLGK
jgi:hypothetical protein